MSCDHSNLRRLHWVDLVKTQREYTCTCTCTVHTVVVGYSELFQNTACYNNPSFHCFILTFSLFRDVMDL